VLKTSIGRVVVVVDEEEIRQSEISGENLLSESQSGDETSSASKMPLSNTAQTNTNLHCHYRANSCDQPPRDCSFPPPHLKMS
jgi:hypothetical protein